MVGVDDDLAADAPRPTVEHDRDAGVRRIVGAEHGLDLGDRVDLVDLGSGQRADDGAVGREEVDLVLAPQLGSFLHVDRRRDRERPQLLRRQAHAGDDEGVVFLAHEPVEGVVGTPRQQAQVGEVSGGEANGRHSGAAAPSAGDGEGRGGSGGATRSAATHLVTDLVRGPAHGDAGGSERADHALQVSGSGAKYQQTGQELSSPVGG